MSRPPPPMHELARRILKHEIGNHEAPDEVVASIERCFQRLYRELVNVVGHAGYQALLSRALYLTRPELGSLELVIEDEAVQFDGLAESVARLGAPRTIGGATSLLAQFIAVTSLFLGEELALRLVRRIWMEAPRGGPSSGLKDGT